MKKILIACLILVAAIAAIGMAAAVQSEVNLPDGYELDESQSIANQSAELFGVACDYNRAVMVNGDKNITVDTFFPHAEITLHDGNGFGMKNISGTEGLFKEVDGRFLFVYSDNDQFVQINAPEEKLIEEVIGK